MKPQQQLLDLGGAADLVAVQDPVIDFNSPVVGGEPKGVVYTKRWVVDLILDLAGYRPENDLGGKYAVEPAAGEGAFFLPMVGRLMESLQTHGRPLADARTALRAHELDERSAGLLSAHVEAELRRRGVGAVSARKTAQGWVSVGDYLLSSLKDRRADWVLGNPPYIRYDDLPEGAFEAYRYQYRTMIGRCDIYVAFIEAGLRQLTEGGVLGFICADRWMRSSYGAELRRLVARSCSVEAMVEMHNAAAFEDDVSAYPSVVVLRRGAQSRAVVAVATSQARPPADEASLADAIIDLADGRTADLAGFTASRLDGWFDGSGPWPSLEPDKLDLLRALEGCFGPLEDAGTRTKVGIGVATGNDQVYVTKDPNLVEPERLLPLAMAADTRSGALKWSGHYLVDPWREGGGLVDLRDYPRLRGYFEEHRLAVARRNVAKRNARDWYRTIDRVNHQLTTQPKLYFPDMKAASNPTLDRGTTYPHHNLYFVTSEDWDLEVLGGLLLSRVAQLFIEAYCVRMRGGTLRFQAQYLRRIRVPRPATMSSAVAEGLRAAFRSRDSALATEAALDAYGVPGSRGLLLC
jgi:hypothetical protein